MWGWYYNSGSDQTAVGSRSAFSFFSKKLDPTQVRYSTFDREMFACFAAIRHFRYLLEGWQFTLLTDHKPLMYAVQRTSDPWTGRQARQLAYITEFTSDIQHISGMDNLVADTLSRPAAEAAQPAAVVSPVAAMPAVLDYAAIALSQQGCPLVQRAVASSAMRVRPVVLGDTTLLCDVSTGACRPLIPKQHRRQVFTAFHCLAHPGARATRRLLAARVVWPCMAADINGWCRECQNCGRGKVTVQLAVAVESTPIPKHRFSHIYVDLVGPLLVSADGFTYLLTSR
jgi:cleavage and polyadenylation specificity factor subunit 1